MSCVASPAVSIRDFVPEMDSIWLHGLWHRTMHERWAISLEAMSKTLADSLLLLIAECNGLACGFCAVASHRKQTAGLTVLLVEPARQNCGIGSELVMRVEKELVDRNIRKLALGAGDGDYFWPGLPDEQSNTLSFFRERGFVEEEASEDLIQELADFHTPSWVSTRLASSGSLIYVAEPTDRNLLISFERQHFPAWAPFFESEMEHGSYANILFARGLDGEVLGTVLLRHDSAIPWSLTSGTRIGTLNTLGVAPDKRGQGVGLALTAGAMKHLRKRGCSHCLIQWTGLTEWYGKLGAKRWARYHMAFKNL